MHLTLQTTIFGLAFIFPVVLYLPLQVMWPKSAGGIVIFIGLLLGFLSIADPAGFFSAVLSALLGNG